MLGEIEVKTVKIPEKIISCYLPGSKTQFRKNVKRYFNSSIFKNEKNHHEAEDW
ncbi:MAG: hypothetical protein LBK13_08845 [Spirochaetales bacterium]|nr:hypothetical protein [Spirochaetales bacterium]